MNPIGQPLVETVTRVVIVASALCGANLPADRVGMLQHIRAPDREVAVVIAEAVQRSATIRQLVRRLDDSDMVVYVERTDDLDAPRAGQLTFMTSAGGLRYVRVQLHRRLTPRQQMVALGHELRHAVEIADAPFVVDATTLRHLYQRIGFEVGRRPHAFESSAAIATERQVRKDVAAGPSRRSHAELASSIRRRDDIFTPAVYAAAVGPGGAGTVTESDRMIDHCRSRRFIRLHFPVSR